MTTTKTKKSCPCEQCPNPKAHAGKLRRFYRAMATPANRKLHEIIDTGERFLNLLSEFADEGHGNQCRCNYCRYDQEAGSAQLDSYVEDIQGVRYNVEIFLGFITSATFSSPQETLARALKSDALSPTEKQKIRRLFRKTKATKNAPMKAAA